MEKQYRVSELFASIQGEGKFAGTPSIWVRVFGCNIDCEFCDTTYSWQSQYKNDHPTYSATQIFQQLKQLITNEYNPEGKLLNPLTGNYIHLVFTGGEPMLKRYQLMMMKVLTLFSEENDRVNFTVETNGMLEICTEFKEFLNDNDGIYPFFSISPKLKSVSNVDNAVNVDNIIDILSEYHGAIKFVADMTLECEQEIINYTKQLFQAYTDYYIMPIGETLEEQLTNAAPIAEKYQALGYNIATRNHVYLWSNERNR